MEFKELQRFNDAMLAKQVWRLLEDKTSRFHRFFKEIFFQMGIFSLRRKVVDPLSGEVSLKVERSLKREPNGEWEVARTSSYTRISGYLTPNTLAFNPS